MSEKTEGFMRITALLGLLLFMSLMSVAVARADFIVVQEEEQTHPGGTNKSKITTMIKGSMIRIDREFPPMTTLINHATGKTTGLFRFDKTYNETSPSQEKEALEGIADRLKQ